MGLEFVVAEEVPWSADQEGCYYHVNQLFLPVVKPGTAWTKVRKLLFGFGESPPRKICYAPAPSQMGLLEVGVDYPGQDIAILDRIPGPLECDMTCLQVKTCVAWSWGPAVERQDDSSANMNHVCSLKYAAPTQKVKQGRAVSGMPVETRVVYQEPTGGLYCFTVVVLASMPLLRLQYDKGVSIFACDQYTIYSNSVKEVARGVNTEMVTEDVNCPTDAHFHHCVIIGMFRAIWSQVISDNKFMEFTWTVKVDPDVVFLPQRLRLVLADYGAPARGAFLNNCKYGLLGSLQVFSREAVTAYAGMGDQCFGQNHEFSFDTTCQEGYIVETCLRTVLRLKRIDEFRLLSDPHCGGEHSNSCSGNTVAFHPFKNVTAYAGCLAEASQKVHASS